MTERERVEDPIKINALERPYDEVREKIPPRWEAEHVGRRLVKAFVTLDRLPRLRGPREPGGHWPQHSVEWADRLARAELSDAERRTREAAQNFTILRPTGADIAQMEAAFDWLRELRGVDLGHGARDEPLGFVHGKAPIGAQTLRAETLGALHILS